MARHARAVRVGRNETLDRILAVACELFARHGYRATTVRMIANHAGLSEPGVYYYFPTKRQLHDALLIRPPIDTPLPANSNLESAIEAMASFFTKYAGSSNLVRLSFREQISGTSAAVQFHRDNDTTYRDIIGPFFREYYGEGAGQMEDLVTFMLSGLFWDAILQYGDEFETVVRADAFQKRLRKLLQSALPVVGRPLR